ncbi:hypothetical protein H4S08_000168 [Coemansia sp. RSA 1365]|nr:hypothetical protein H4S08_000168 [Coemansia sp. RSA 1365]
MQRTTKPETSRSMSAVTYHQSPSLVSLPMLPRPSTAAMASTLALSNAQADYHKRQRVNSKAGALGSLFRTKIHAKRGSNAGSEGMSPVLEPLADLQTEASWEVSIDSPAVMSPLFTDESLQQLLGSSPQLAANGPISPLGGQPVDGELAPGGSPSPASARRSKREIAASVLHTSAVPFRRLRQGPVNKTLSFPPAVSTEMFEDDGEARPGGDEFVVVTPDMCPPASLVSSSVISGVSPLEASAAAAAAAAAASVASGIDSDSARSGGGANRAALRKHPRGGGALPLRTRALTQVSQQSGEQMLLMGYEDSTDSLVRISTPSLSASSSEASLPLSHVRKKPPAPLLAWTQPRPRHGGFQHGGLQPLQSLAPPSGTRPPLPRHASSGSGSPRKASECSFSSAEGLRRVSPFGPLDALSPYTVGRLSSTAARATERRRRSSMRRSRPSSVASSVNWNLSATSDLTLLTGSAHARHTRNASESSEFLDGFTAGTHGSTFDFQLHSAAPEPLWPPDASPLASDGDASDNGDDDDLARRIPMSGFPSSCSAHFNVELGRDTESACESPRTRTRSSGANASRNAARAHPARVYPRASRAIMSLLDPSSPVHGDAEHSMALNMLGHPRRQRAYTSALPDAEREDPAELSDPLDFDGSTLTQQNDWQLMNPSSSDNDMPPPLPHHSHTRRRVRKRRVLPKSMFPVPAKHVHAPVTVTSSHDLPSSDTLRPRSDIVTPPAIAVRQSEVPLPATTSDISQGALPFAAATPAPPPEMLRLLRLEVIPRTPLSIQCDMRIVHVARLTLQCSGDARSWQPARISCFDLRLAACIERAHGLVELSLVNLGLTVVPVRLLGCHGLRRLDMAHNWIATAPGWLGRLRRLEHLRLAGNPLRMISADLVELRHHLLSLDLGRTHAWSLISRRPAPLPELSPDKRKRVLAARLQSTAARRVAAYLDAAVLKVTRRQHDDARARATRLLGLYSDTLYAALREPRNWGHSVAMPLPSGL